MWPFTKQEKRSSRPYTEAILDAQLAGASQARPSATAALESSAGVVSRAFASAKVEDAPPSISDAITPAVLAQIGRELIRTGESLHVIEVRRGELRLLPVGSWDVRGGADPARWSVRVSRYGPSATETQHLPHNAVIHCQFATDPHRPWLGIAPLDWANLTSAIHASSAGALRADLSASSATVIPMPASGEGDEDDDQLGGLKSSIHAARGRSVLVETLRAALGGDHRDAPLGDWQQKRLGPTPDATLLELHDRTERGVMAACGVDPILVGLDRGDGAASREAYRKFERLTIQPLARQVERELRDKLDAPSLRLRFDSLRASDFAGIARSYKSMVEAGLTPQQAGAILDLPI